MTTPENHQRALEILAKSVYRDLKQNGYARADIVAFASAILAQLTSEAKRDSQVPSDNAA